MIDKTIREELLRRLFILAVTATFLIITGLAHFLEPSRGKFIAELFVFIAFVSATTIAFYYFVESCYICYIVRVDSNQSTEEEESNELLSLEEVTE